MVIYSSPEKCQWVKVTLYVHLSEQITKSLNHGLSETILVNTLTDIREFKNQNPPKIHQKLKNGRFSTPYTNLVESI